ncbi:MAG: DNA repair protein RecO [Planctomycetes bacterium]|nr:DNA repair protein RecO [Planctomycetota bacterium]
MQEKDRAICLRCVNYSETSQVVTLLTRRHGKIACMAKGSKRSKSATDGPIEPFSFGPVVFSTPKGEGLAVLSEFSQESRFRPLRQNLFALNCGLLTAELIESFTENSDPHEGLFDATVSFLDTVQNRSRQNFQLADLIGFELTLLNEIGVGLVTQWCANCSTAFSNRWKYAYFSNEVNGLVCPGCESSFVDKTRLDVAAAAGLSQTENLKKLPLTVLETLHKAMLNHFTALLHRPPKLASFFLSQ